MVHIGHDAYLHNNAEITAGCIIGGFADIDEKVYIGINTCVRNRIALGRSCVIGMGATVIKAVEDGTTVAGNPAKVLK